MNHRFAILCASALLLSVPALAHAQAATSSRPAAPTMEALVKSTGEAYKVTTSGTRTWYVMNMINNGQAAVIALSEERDWLGQAGLAKGRIEVPWISLTAAPTPQLLQAVAAFNNRLTYGSVIVDESGAYYVHDVFMNGITSDALGLEIGVSFFLSQSAMQEFAAYVE